MADHPVSEESAAKQQEKSHPVLQTTANNGPRSPPLEKSLRTSQSPHMGHRQSFAENLRGNPSSPRARRQPSFSQQALQDLLNNPPTKAGSPEFVGRDWRSIQVGEVVDHKQVQFVEYDTSVEETTKALIETGPPNVVLIRDSPESHTAVGTFDYNDLNAYLLLVVGLARPAEEDAESVNKIVTKAREGNPIALREVKDLGKKEPLIFLPHTADLKKAMELFGSGIHRMLIVKEGTTEILGILTQLRLVRFFWENRKSFPAIDQLYSQYIKDLSIGSHSVFAINGDKPLTDALELMNNEGITSLPVLDNQNNVIGNISHVDVRLLTKSTSLPLLSSSCIHFISVILSERGMNDGKDSFPVFHINTMSTLAHTVAKLVATRSHRMWIVDQPSPASSGPPTPAITPTVLVPPSPITPLPSAASSGFLQAAPPPVQPAPAISASAIAGASMSGRLCGVVSLTDVLNLFAKASGLKPHDPDETRRARRRSSSSSMRQSLDSSRSGSVDVQRRGSVSGGVSGPGVMRGRGL